MDGIRCYLGGLQALPFLQRLREIQQHCESGSGTRPVV